MVGQKPVGIPDQLTLSLQVDEDTFRMDHEDEHKFDSHIPHFSRVNPVSQTTAETSRTIEPTAAPSVLVLLHHLR